jgi:2-keto-3-deoxy-L-rhamnonate aldolase RhmA
LPQSFRKLLKEGRKLIGTLVTIPRSEIIESVETAGFDWALIDMEHSALGISDVNLLVSAAKSIPCLVRMASYSAAEIGQVLDCGAAGVIIPQVSSANDAAMAVAAVRYPPEGFRSVGISRAHAYGAKFSNYMENANAQLAVVAQIETVAGVNAISEIVAVKGLDCIFLGPYNLSGSMGMLGKLESRELRAAMAKVRNACIDAGMPLGIFGLGGAAVRPFLLEGFSLLALGVDTALYKGALDTERSLLFRD